MKKLVIPIVFMLLIKASKAQDSTHFKPVTYKAAVTTMSDMLELKGYLHSLTDTSINLTATEVKFNGYDGNTAGTKGFSYKDISMVQLRRKGSTGRGILIGALSGAVAGIVIGYASGDDYKKNTDGWCLFCLTAGEKAAGYGVLLGATGALAGGIVGALVHKTFDIKSRKEKFDELKWKLIQ